MYNSYLLSSTAELLFLKWPNAHSFWRTFMVCFRTRLFPESAVRNIMFQILQGLAFIHKHGMPVYKLSYRHHITYCTVFYVVCGSFSEMVMCVCLVRLFSQGYETWEPSVYGPRAGENSWLWPRPWDPISTTIHRLRLNQMVSFWYSYKSKYIASNSS